jgi:hypothetical protein
MSPICNLRAKVIGIKCESSVMCAAQSRNLLDEPLPGFGGGAASSTGGPRRKPDLDLTGKKLSTIPTSTPSL